MKKYSFELRFDSSEIDKWAKAYDTKGDADTEVERISHDIRNRGYLTQEEFTTICLWKSPRVKTHIEKNSEAVIKEVTELALRTESEAIRIDSLTLLRGVQYPVASAILHFSFKDKYPILDFRALWSLGLNTPPSAYTAQFWEDYTTACREIAEKNNKNMRTLDRALWAYSAEHQPKG